MVAQNQCTHANWKQTGKIVYCPDCGAILAQEAYQQFKQVGDV